ncbi:hypothetical protein ABH937_002039 [Kitasatospora sp. GAS1066B]
MASEVAGEGCDGVGMEGEGVAKPAQEPTEINRFKRLDI